MIFLFIKCPSHTRCLPWKFNFVRLSAAEAQQKLKFEKKIHDEVEQQQPFLINNIPTDSNLI